MKTKINEIFTDSTDSTDIVVEKRKFYQSALSQIVVFVSIVILGLLGMICVFSAHTIADFNMDKYSLNEVKSNYYTDKINQYGNYNILKIAFDILDDKDKEEVEDHFINNNILGVDYYVDNFSQDSFVGSYGDVSNENTIKFTYTHHISSTNNYNEFHLFNYYILKDAPLSLNYHKENKLIEFLYYNKTNVWTVGVIIGIMIAWLYVFLICITGYTKKSDILKPLIFCKIPMEFNFIIAMILGYIAIEGASYSYYYFANNINNTHHLVGHLLYMAMAQIIFLCLSMDISMRVKTKTLFKTSIVGLSLMYCATILKNLSLLWKYMLGYCVVSISIFLGLLIFSGYIESIAFAVYIIFNILIFPIVMYVVLAYIDLLNATEIIAKGDYEYTVKPNKILCGFTEFAENLNDISGGMEDALNEKMKSELLKTELITNVSNDIKTPLTSIINYSDLICKEKSNNEKITEYSNVLHRQSNKLKKLIDDLIEASNASSGNIVVDLQEIKFNVFIEQVIGEYQEKLADISLELIANIEQDVTIKADGKLLSRVFDNLFNNILKYSLEDTRVYLDTEIIDNFLVVSIKNTSKYQLNINQDLLTERFIRGDLSRKSEGYGLGLSIAKNLVYSQNGAFDIVIDGDLFKVIVKINLA